MFRRKPQTRPNHATPDVAPGNKEGLLPVLTYVEVLAIVSLLEEYVEQSPDDSSKDIAGTLIVRLLDRLRTTVHRTQA